MHNLPRVSGNHQPPDIRDRVCTRISGAGQRLKRGLKYKGSGCSRERRGMQHDLTAHSPLPSIAGGPSAGGDHTCRAPYASPETVHSGTRELVDPLARGAREAQFDSVVPDGGCSSAVPRAPGCGPGCRGFESHQSHGEAGIRLPLKLDSQGSVFGCGTGRRQRQQLSLKSCTGAYRVAPRSRDTEATAVAPKGCGGWRRLVGSGRHPHQGEKMGV